jgi:tRNA (guanine37-N1)-methyltransferase
MWTIDIFTLQPAMFPGPLGESLSGDALLRGVWSLAARDIREHGRGRHRAVDDTPAGGGPGMVIRADVLADSLDAHLPPSDPRPRLLLSPRGVPLRQEQARSWAQGPGLALVCGRFEGVDERIIAARGLMEVSIGDYVLSGGELAAMVLLDACIRLLPGVMGSDLSHADESFECDLLEYPQFTRPREWEGRAIPDVLTSGDHRRIDAWRRHAAEALTAQRRPDLINRRSLKRTIGPNTLDEKNDARKN